MMRDQEIPDTSLEEMVLYQNIRRPSITKAAMCQELFPFSNVIGWILPQTDSSLRIISDVKGEAFASLHPAHTPMAYNLPSVQIMMTEDRIKGIKFDPLEYAKKMVVPRKQLRQKASGEYES